MPFNPFADLKQATLAIIAAGLALLCAALLAVTAVQTARIDGFLWIDGLKDRLAARDQTIADITAASARAAQGQAAANHAPAQTSRTIAEQSDAKSPEYYADVRRAAAAYAAAHPVVGVRCPAAEGPGGGPDLPRTDRAAAVDDGPGDPAQLVAVARPDFDICTVNSARLDRVRQDAQALIAAGVAEASGP